MSEEKCCILGKNPKIFSYIRDGKYFHTVCKLKDEIDCFKLNEFFNKVYSVKLDVWDACFFYGVYTTADLIRIFRLILETDNFINLKDLSYLIGNGYEDMSCHPVREVIKYFFDLFDIIDYKFVYLSDLEMLKKIVIDSSDVFYKEVESIFYNSSVIDFLYKKDFVKVRKHS